MSAWAVLVAATWANKGVGCTGWDGAQPLFLLDDQYDGAALAMDAPVQLPRPMAAEVQAHFTQQPLAHYARR